MTPVHPGTEHRKKIEGDLFAALGRLEQAATLQGKGEVTEVYVSRKRDEAKQVLSRYREACQEEVMDHADKTPVLRVNIPWSCTVTIGRNGGEWVAKAKNTDYENFPLKVEEI